MENVDNTVQPQIKSDPKVVAQINFYRLGKIFGNMATAAVILIALFGMSTIIAPVAYMMIFFFALLLVICMIVFTLGLVFVAENSPLPAVWDFISNMANSPTFHNIITFCYNAIPWLCLAIIVFSALSITLVSLSKQKGISGTIVLLVISSIIAAIVGGAIWLL